MKIHLQKPTSTNRFICIHSGGTIPTAIYLLTKPNDNGTEVHFDIDDPMLLGFMPDEVIENSEPNEPSIPDVAGTTGGNTITGETTTGLKHGVETGNTKRSVKQRKTDLEQYSLLFLQAPKIDDRKPVFVSGATRDRLDRIVRLLGDRRMSVSGLIENLARHHLSIYEDDIDYWRKL